MLDGWRGRRISAYLVDGNLDDAPATLRRNTRKAFQGSIILGAGFTFDDRAAAKGLASPLCEMRCLIEANPANQERIFPYIGGDEITSDPEHRHHRYVIDLADLGEAEVRRRWPDLMDIVERLVKGTRAEHSTAPWWQFERRRPELYAAIAGVRHVFVNASKATPHHALAVVPNGMVYSQNLNVFALSEFAAFACLSSRTHEVMARFLGTTMKDDFTYDVESCFETFPFPDGFETDWVLETMGRQAYHDHRAALLVRRNEGMTKAYNRFHSPRETAADIVRLRELHTEIDRAVLRAYGWDDLADRAEPQFLDETNEDDHKYQGRLFWPAEFRDEVLARLFALNAERAAAEREDEPLAPYAKAKRAAKRLAEAELPESVAADEND